jgi:hypothetical protein
MKVFPKSTNIGSDAEVHNNNSDTTTTTKTTNKQL